MSALKTFKNRLFARFVLYTTLPAIILFVSKFSLMLVLAKYYNVSYTNFESTIVFSNFEDFIFINDLSNIISYIILASFTIWLVIKAYFFHHSHVSPKFSAWLNVQSLENLLVGSLEIYLKSVSFVLFLWLTTLMVFGNAILGLGSYWVFYFCLVSSAIISVLLIVDMERDHQIMIELKKLSI